MATFVPLVVEPTASGERSFDIYSRELNNGSIPSAAR